MNKIQREFVVTCLNVYRILSTVATGRWWKTLRIKIQYNNNTMLIWKKVKRLVNRKLLKSKQALHGDIDSTLAAALGITPQTFSLKVNEKNGAEFTTGEMKGIKLRYNLTDEEFTAIFFASEVS